jgi:hypothetical protein
VKITVKNISKEDLSGSNWALILTNYLQRYFEQITNILNGGIAIENTKNKQEEITFYNSSSGFVPIKIRTTFTPTEIRLVSISSASLVTTAVTITDWSYDNSQSALSINYIAGLLSDTEYTIKVIII